MEAQESKERRKQVNKQSSREIEIKKISKLEIFTTIFLTDLIRIFNLLQCGHHTGCGDNRIFLKGSTKPRAISDLNDHIKKDRNKKHTK